VGYKEAFFVAACGEFMPNMDDGIIDPNAAKNRHNGKLPDIVKSSRSDWV
jgi:hypothetical protein